MKKILLIIAAVAVLVAIVITCVGLYVVRTPEFALLMIARDVKSSGLGGLRPHLTEDVQKKLDTVTSLADNKLVGALMGLFGKEDYAQTLATKLQQVQWKLEDLTKGDGTAEVVLGFNYEDRIIGTVSFTMANVDGDWKIDSFELPKFDEFNRE